MANNFLNLIVSLYIYSPQRNLKKLFEKIGSLLTAKNTPIIKDGETDNNREKNEQVVYRNAIEKLWSFNTFADILAYKIQSSGKSNLYLLGDKSQIDSWDLSSKCHNVKITVLDWNWFSAFPLSSMAEDSCLIICRIPMGLEEWEYLSSLRKQYRETLLTITELLLPFANISTLQSNLDYYIESFDGIIPFYLGKEYFGPLQELNEEFDLAGKKIIEFGPLDACQTASLVHLKAGSIDCIEVRSENVVKTLAVINAFGWKQVQVFMDDFHDVSSIKYGRYDLAFAHGVYYHSIAPFIFLENLVSLSDNIFIGGYCATDTNPPGPFATLIHEGIAYRVKRYEETTESSTAGINTYGYFFQEDDLMDFFRGKGYAVKVISYEPQEVTAGLFLRFLAQRIGHASNL